MSRKDYRIIARAIAELPPSDYKARLIAALSTVLKKDNPNFDRARFQAECYASLGTEWIR